MNNQNKNHKYERIMNLPHHTSSTHPRMSEHARAAQFSPFAALTGYDDAIKETARLTQQRIELDELEKEILDKKLRLIEKSLPATPEVTITYFKPDARKVGGEYLCVTGTIKKIDHYQRCILMDHQQKIAMQDIVKIDSEWFHAVNG